MPDSREYPLILFLLAMLYFLLQIARGLGLRRKEVRKLISDKIIQLTKDIKRFTK